MEVVQATPPTERTITVELTETEAEAIRSIFWFGFPSGLTYTSVTTGQTVRIDGITDPLEDAGVGVSETPKGSEYRMGRDQKGWGLAGSGRIALERDWHAWKDNE